MLAYQGRREKGYSAHYAVCQQLKGYSMITENQIKDQVQIARTKAEQMEYWDGEPELQYNKGYIHALNWVLGIVKAQYNKEDI